MERDAGPFAPARAITRLRDMRPVSPMVFPDGHQGWLVTGYAEVREVLADTRFSSRSDLGVLHMPYDTPGRPAATAPSSLVPGLFIGMDPPDHTRLRRTLAGAFTARRMKLLEDHIVELTERRLDEISLLAPPVDLLKEFALPVPTQVICELLGVPYVDRETFGAYFTSFRDPESSPRKKMAAYARLSIYLAGLAKRKRAAPDDDILSDLARNHDLSIEELAGISFLLLLVGHESSAHTLALSVLALLENPEQLAELRADPDLLPGAVEELMRYVTQADIFLRYATESVELGGQRIAEGSTVVLSLLAANRDPRRFENPEVLDFHRSTQAHLFFGHGIHKCMGQQLTRVEMRAAISGLLRRFPTMDLAIPAEELRHIPSIVNRGVRELPVTWNNPSP